jgi:uncharacterized protein
LFFTWHYNLSCRYCYNGNPPAGDMPPDVLESAINLLENGRGPFHVQLTGGEPMLAPGLVERALGLVAAFQVRSGRPGTVALQTNGTLLDQNILNLLKKAGASLGVSIDGPPDTNEAQRGGTRELLRGLDLITSASLHFNVLGCILRCILRCIFEMHIEIHIEMHIEMHF